MSEQILIKYDEVYDNTAQLKSSIGVGISEVNQIYFKIQASLGDLDSLTNESIKEAMRQHQRKAGVAAQVIYELLNFIEASARHIEVQEHLWATFYSGFPCD